MDCYNARTHNDSFKNVCDEIPSASFRSTVGQYQTGLRLTFLFLGQNPLNGDIAFFSDTRIAHKVNLEPLVQVLSLFVRHIVIPKSNSVPMH